MLTEHEITSLISELPEAALRELAEEISALQESTAQFGATKAGVHRAAQQELHRVVSEIYNPP